MLKNKSQIVQSPEKVRKYIKDMGEALENEKAATEEVERKTREFKARAEGLSKIHKEITRAIQLLEELNAEMNRAKEANRGLKDIKSKISESEAKLRQQEAAETQVGKQLTQMQDKQTRFQKRQETKREGAVISLEEVKRAKANAESELWAAKTKVDQNESMIKQVQQKIAEATREHDTEMALAHERLEQLEEQVNIYHQQLERTMQKPILIKSM